MVLMEVIAKYLFETNDQFREVYENIWGKYYEWESFW